MYFVKIYSLLILAFGFLGQARADTVSDLMSVIKMKNQKDIYQIGNFQRNSTICILEPGLSRVTENEIFSKEINKFLASQRFTGKSNEWVIVERRTSGRVRLEKISEAAIPFWPPPPGVPMAGIRCLSASDIYVAPMTERSVVFIDKSVSLRKTIETGCIENERLIRSLPKRNGYADLSRYPRISEALLRELAADGELVCSLHQLGYTLWSGYKLFLFKKKEKEALYLLEYGGYRGLFEEGYGPLN